MSWQKGKSGSPSTQFAKGTSGNPNGPPRILVPQRDLHVVEELAAKGCREKDIARGLGMAQHTWTKCLHEQPEVKDAFDQGRQRLHDSLVNRLVQLALKGNVACLIYATKVLLGYKESDGSPDQRPIVNINLPGAAASLEEWQKQRALTVQAERVDG